MYQAKTTSDDYYYIYAWDVVDIFFATAVASLPALNVLADNMVEKLRSISLGSKSSGSNNSATPFRLRMLNISQHYNNSLSLHKSQPDKGPYFKEARESFDPILHRKTEVELVSTSAPSSERQYRVGHEDW